MRDEGRPGPSTRVRVHEVRTPTWELRRREDRLATEEPLEIRLGWPGRSAGRVAVTMRTPGDDFELAAGFLLGEGLVTGVEDVRTVAYCTEGTLAPEQRYNVVTVELDGPPRRTPAERYAGPSAAASACGVCGAQSIADVVALGDLARSSGRSSRWAGLRVPAAVLTGIPDLLREQQRVFARTGGLHAAGLFDADGTPLVVREDIGRHNAVDKAVGARLLAGEAAAAPLLCVSGRIGFEIAQKAAVAGVGVLLAVGAPSSLAVSVAERAGLTMAGFVSRDRLVCYACPERLGV